MREDESDCISKWEEDLPSPEDLIPLSQSLISPNLALAFNIQNSIPTTPSQLQFPSQANSSAAAAESTDLGSGDEPTRALKRPRLVWTPQLHKRFVDAVAHLGIKNAVPKTIMQMMSVDGLTRENVASHLQKYRLYLKRMSSGGGGGGGVGSDPVTDRLFASSPVPAHFLNPNRVSNSEHFMSSFIPIATLQQQQQIAAATATAAASNQFHYRQISNAHFGSPTTNGQFNSAVVNGQFGSPTANGKFDLLLMARQTQTQPQPQPFQVGNYGEDLESENAKVLTLFPTRDD